MNSTSDGQLGIGDLQQPGLADPQVLLDHPRRGAQAVIEQLPGPVGQRLVRLSGHRVQQDDIDVAPRCPGQAEIDSGQVVAEVESVGFDRGDRPVQHRCARDPAYGVDRKPEGHRQPAAADPDRLTDDRELRVGLLGREPHPRRWSLGGRSRGTREQTGLGVVVAAGGEQHGQRTDQQDQPRPRRHFLILRASRPTTPCSISWPLCGTRSGWSMATTTFPGRCARSATTSPLSTSRSNSRSCTPT